MPKDLKIWVHRRNADHENTLDPTPEWRLIKPALVTELFSGVFFTNRVRLLLIIWGYRAKGRRNVGVVQDQFD